MFERFKTREIRLQTVHLSHASKVRCASANYALAWKRRICVAALIVTTLLAPLTSAWAQQSAPLALGLGVGVSLAPTITTNQLVGTTSARMTDPLAVKPEKAPVSAAIQLSPVTELEVRQGRKWRTLEGALIGTTAASAILSFVVSSSSEARELCDPSDVSCDLGDAFRDALAGSIGMGTAGGGAILLGGIGALIGSTIKTDREHPETSDRVRVRIRPRLSGGLSVSVSVGF